MTAEDDVFEALAHPTRRRILVLVSETPLLPAGAIAASFPGLSRPGISRHVGILQRANLLRAEATGRELRYTVDTAPLKRAYAEFFDALATAGGDALAALKRRIEENP